MWRSVVLAAAVSAMLTGCSHAAMQYGRDGLAPIDHAVRTRLSAGQYGSAYEAAHGRDARARDRLLRALSVGTLGLYANRTDSSVWALDRAWTMAEERWSRRVSEELGALVVSDQLRPYAPGSTERLFIPFYGALSWLSRGDRDDAAVEARRLVQLLGEAAPDGGATVDAELRGVLHYVAGAVFEAAGEPDAADVAYRNADRLVRVPVRRDSTRADSLSGDVVVVVEQGFVGHPVPREEIVWVSRGELSVMEHGQDGRGHSVAGDVWARKAGRGYAGTPGPLDVGISLHWAEFGAGRPLPTSLNVSAGLLSEVVAGSGNVTRAVRADFNRTQPARFARALVRAAARATLYTMAGDQLVKANRDRRDDKPVRRAWRGGDSGTVATATGRPAARETKDVEKEHTVRTLGRVLAGVGLFSLAASSEVADRPDVRSWNLLPDDVRVVRLRLPAGEQEVQAVVDGVPVTVGRAVVRPGQVTVLSYRAFGPGRRDLALR